MKKVINAHCLQLLTYLGTADVSLLVLVATSLGKDEVSLET